MLVSEANYHHMNYIYTFYIISFFVIFGDSWRVSPVCIQTVNVKKSIFIINKYKFIYNKNVFLIIFEINLFPQKVTLKFILVGYKL